MIFAISDLHLGFASGKNMDKFGQNWVNHHEKIKKNWISKINENDTVLLCGDISWAMRAESVWPDLEFIDNLPGKKIIISGNHDYYFSQINKIKNAFETISFLIKNHFVVENKIICGSRGWVCPGSSEFAEKDNKIYLRELQRLKASLDSCRDFEDRDIYIMLHFPPTNENKENSGFIDIFKDYKIKKVIYGHLHGNDYFSAGLQGFRDNIEYILTSCDFLDFDPILIS